MPQSSEELAALAAINLHFAQAEVTLIADRKSIERAIDHIDQAQAYLKIMLTESEAPPEEDEEEAA